MLRRLRIEAQAPRSAAGEVLEVALAGQADQAVGEDLPLGHRPCIGGDRVVSGGSSHGVQERFEGILGRLVADPDAGAGAGGHAELGGDPHHDVDLLVGDRDVGALHRVAVRRLHHGAVALDRGDRLDPERMGLAVGGEHAAIEPGEQPELGQLLRQPLPLLPGLVAEAGRAGGEPWRRVAARHR